MTSRAAWVFVSLLVRAAAGGLVRRRLALLVASLALWPARAGAQDTPPPGERPAEAAPKVVPPRLLHFEEAPYPQQAMEQGIEAAVTLAVRVEETGEVGEVQVLEPAGHGFDEAAAAAVRRFRFEPARLGDKPVAVVIRFTYRFTLEEEEVPGPAEAQESLPAVSLAGQVLRRGRREPLAGIGVRVRGRDESAETDAQGRFELRLPPGTWGLELLHPEYEPFRTEESIAEGERLDVTYYVEPRSGARYRTVVEARREKKTVTRTSLDQVELVRVPGTLGEPFRVVQALPGVARAPFGAGFLLVRGAAPQDTGFFVDGFEVPLLYHFLSGPAVFQADLIESLDFYPGGFPVSYGRKLAGAVTCTTKEKDPVPRTGGKVALDLLDVEALIEVPVGERSQVSAAFRRSHLDLVIPLAADVTVIPYYWDYQLVASSRTDGGWRGKALLFGSYDRIEVPPDEGEDPFSYTTQFHRLQARAWRPIFDGGRLDLSGMVGWGGTETAVGEGGTEDTAWTLGLRGLLRLPLIKERLEARLGLDVGALLSHVDVDLAGKAAAGGFPQPRGSGTDAAGEVLRTRYGFDLPGLAPALFADLEWRLGPLLLIPGLRADWLRFADYDELTLDPRLVARLRVGEALRLKGGVGIFHQPPSAIELDPDMGSPATLHAPFALQYSVGAEVRPLEHLDVDLTLFHNSFRDLVVEGQAVGDGAYVNDGEGRAYGLELLLRLRPHGPFFGWIAYTLSRSERRRRGGDWTLSMSDQTHILTAVASLRLGSRWTAGLKFQLVTGAPRTPVLGGVYDADADRWNAVLGDPLSDRNPMFHQLDLRVDREFLFDTWRLTAYLDVLNVYNAPNSEFMQYSYDFSESSVVTGIPFVPSFGVQAEL